jgi:ABC-2 type transport system ATP-binding protein
VIQLNHIHFGYNQTELFADVHVNIPMGRIYGLLGKNGVGKTTMLKLMAGLRFARSGKCLVLDEDSSQRPASMLAEIFFLPEEFSLPDISVHQYQRMYAPFYPKFDPESFWNYLQRFELDADKNLNAYSFGQKKKFLLAFGLAANTRIMLLDEPTNGLDIPSKSQFRQVLASDFTDERLIIISTHQARDLERIIDAVIILNEGAVLFHELVENVSERLAVNFQSTSPDKQAALHVENVPGGYNVVTAARQDDGQCMDLETLFNTVVSNPEKIATIFSSS